MKTPSAGTVLIENKGSGTGLIQQLQSEQLLRPIAIDPEGSKADRMAAQSAYIEAGYLLVPENAPWLDDFEAEIVAFPFARHDDQVDSASQFLTWINKPYDYFYTPGCGMETPPPPRHISGRIRGISSVTTGSGSLEAYMRG